MWRPSLLVLAMAFVGCEAPCGEEQGCDDDSGGDGDGDADADGVAADADCDDLDPTVGGATPWYADCDEDGTAAEGPTSSCGVPADSPCEGGGGVWRGVDEPRGDCDDADPDATVEAVWHADCDGDGVPGETPHTSCGVPETSCDSGPPAGGWTDAPPATFDCDDADALAVVESTWYPDCDGDGVSAAIGVVACEAPIDACDGGPGDGVWVDVAPDPPDCDDLDIDAFPGAVDVCGDGVDQDCAGGDAPCPTGCLDSDPVVISFADTTGLATSGRVTATFGGGVASVGPIVALNDPGPGGVDWRPASGKTTHPPGTYDYGSVVFAAAAGAPPSTVSVAGDLVLNVAGDLHLGPDDQLDVSGRLTLNVGGEVVIAGASVYALSDLALHHSGSSPVILGDPASPDGTYFNGMNHGSSLAAGVPIPNSGSVSVWSRAGVVLGNATYVGSGRPQSGLATATSGDVSFRAYGDVTTGEDTYVGTAAAASGAPGRFETFVEGSFRLGASSWWTGGPGTAGFPPIALHAGEAIEIASDARLLPSAGGALDVRTEGPIVTAGQIVALAPGVPGRGGVASVVRAGELRMTEFALVEAGPGELGGVGGDLLLDVLGDVSVGADLEGPAIEGGAGRCADGGDVIARVGGDLALWSGGVFGGEVRGAACTEGVPGGVDVRVAGSITVDEATASGFLLGDGTPAAEGAVAGGVPVDVAPVDHDVWRDAEIRVASALSCRTAMTGAAVTGATGDARLEVRVPGGAWVAAGDLVGQPLPDGWEVRLRLRQRQFDGASAEGFTLTFE